jgi:hypothetical protein
VPYADADTVARKEIERRLAATARRRELITYTDLVRGITFHLPNVAQGRPQQLGVPEWNDLHSAILRDFLNKMSCDSYLLGGILASAVAVRKVTGEPGDGFKSLVDHLGLDAPSRRDEFVVFWSQEVEKTYNWYAAIHNVAADMPIQ